MQGKGIAWRRVLRRRRIPGDNLRCAAEVQAGGRQRGHVQRLADMAGIVGTLGMPVGQSGAKRKVQQRAASY